MRWPLAISVFLALSVLVGAHGGGLDSLGCHNDKRSGTYHCHRGKLAGRVFRVKGGGTSRARRARTEASAEASETARET